MEGSTGEIPWRVLKWRIYGSSSIMDFKGVFKAGESTESLFPEPLLLSMKRRSTASSISSSRPLKSSSSVTLSISISLFHHLDCLSSNMTFLLTSLTTNLLISLRVQIRQFLSKRWLKRLHFQHRIEVFLQNVNGKDLRILSRPDRVCYTE